MRRKLLLPIVAAGAGVSFLISVYRLITILFTPYIYKKDFVQFFLMGNALRAGANLYAPIPELAAQFDPNLDKWFKVSAYPPIVAAFGLPISYLPYFWSVVSWMTIEIVFLALSLFLIVRHFGGRSAATPVLVTVCAFIGWRPVYIELYLGQLMIFLLLLLTLSWLALRAGKEITGGVLLGLVLALKLYAWPIAIFLLVRKRWRACIAATAVFLSANVLMAIWTGGATLIDYYTRVGSFVFGEYKFDPFNFSAWSVGFRLFGFPGAVLALLAVSSFALFLALRSKDFDSGFMIMLTAATILQPISWIHYFVTLLPAFCLVASRRIFHISDLVLALVLIALILPGFYPVAYRYDPMATWPPLLFVIGLIWLLWPKPINERSKYINLEPKTL